MFKTTTHTLSFLLFFLLFSITLSSQTLWPGDLNNNGIVNGIDHLYWAVANQTVGPVRPGAVTDWQEQALGNLWADQFPESTNYAYADVNGDGQVNANDADAISQNFLRNHGTLSPDDMDSGISLTSPSVVGFSDFATEVISGQTVKVNLAIDAPGNGLAAFYGISFTINYPPNTLQADNGINFGLHSESFFNPTNTDTRVFVNNDNAAGRAIITIVRTNQENVSGEGGIGRIVVNFADLSLPGTPATLLFEVTDIVAIDSDMNSINISAGSFSMNNNALGGGACPNTVSPVCGSNGVTYLNSCYAEAAGIYDYTEGSCFDDSCIDADQMNPDAACPEVYEPVCGCNDVTYSNQCAADAAGVVSTTPGPCQTSSCYDPLYIITSEATSLDTETGVITVDCPTAYEPVCGCNGVTYANACMAEASGITVYTLGSCESSCIDPTQMDPDAACTTEYDPVCGCNGVTYTNACRADAAGVVTYTSGPCSGNSSWCEEAIPVQCGDFLPYETSIGAGNDINQYPYCSNTTFLGPDRVYVIQKESAGDLQIGLEILTPGLDLDLFLLAGNCNQITCVGKSTTSNTQTNNEGIVLEDAPIGTYYIVVDGQYADSEGNFRLEVSCGYLHCGDAVALQCGQTYHGNNMYGNDDVSLYGCDGNVLNVENNGPEIVHTFTTTEEGPVNISLSGLSANLELFLLRSCDRGDCVEYSQNSGTNSEYITEYLPAGTYYIVVDGYNGGVSDYSLLVDCSSECDLVFTDLSATSSGCGQSSGVIHISSSGGTPNYLISYSGPLSGSFTTSSNSCTISYLPPGTYTITKTDSQGCSISGTVTILGGGSLSATMTPNEAVCMTRGSIDVWVSNGQAPYTVYVSGPTSGTVYADGDDFTIGNLAAGDYTIHITDANGCSISQNITVEYSSGNFIWNYEVTPANCGAYGAIHVDTYNGDAPYNILLSGPLSGVATVNANSFNIINLPGGTYQLTIEDHNWCQYTRTVVIPDGNLNVEAIPTAGACGQNGSVLVNMTNGIPGFTISWAGPENGSATTSNQSYVIPDLISGSYNITVTDSGGCTDHQTVTVTSGGNDQLQVNVIPLPGSCSQNGALWIDIINGSPIYTITYSGPLSGTLTTSADGLDIPNLPCGTYYLTVTDYNGCSSSQTVVLGGCEVIDLDLNPQNGICGQPGSILAIINGGSPIYAVSWSGPVNGQATTNTNSFNIPNLPAGTYSVQVTDASGCTDYAITQVTTAASNLTLYANTSEAGCNAEGTIGLTISGGIGLYQISWTGPENGNTTSNANYVNLTGLPAGTYQIFVTDGNGCSAVTQAEIINAASDLNLSLVGNDGICSVFGNIGVFVTNGTGPYQIYWNGPIAGNATSANAVYQIPNTPPGTYNVVVTDANGCSVSGIVVINNANTLSAYLQTTPANCGQDGAINVFINQGSPNYTISWTGPESGSATTGTNFYTIPDLTPGVYTVVVTDANGCSSTLNGTVGDVSSNLTINASLIYNVCGQYNTIWVDIMGGTGPYTVIWEGSQNGSGTTNTQGFEIMNLPPGTYKVIVIDVNGCMVMQQGIIIYPTPVNLFTAQPFNGVCGDDGSISVNIMGGTGPYTLSWNGPSSGTQNYAAAGIYALTNLPGGTYVLTLTDANGCTETETVVVNTSSPIEIIAALIYNECGQYNTIWVDIVGGTGPYTVSWEGPQNGSGTTNTQGFEIMDLPPGTYKVIVVDANGCMVMQQGIIIYPTPINIFTAYATPGICGENGDIHINVTGGTGPYMLQYAGPASGTIPVVFGEQLIPDLPTGTYVLTLTDTNGCTEVETVTVISSGNPIVINTALIYNECGQYNTIWVDITGGSGPYTVSWEGPQNGSGTTNTQGFEIMDLPPGTYKVIVVDANGCMVMQQGIIIYPTPIDIFTAYATPGICGENGDIHINVTGGTGPYVLQYTGPASGTIPVVFGEQLIPDLPTGTYVLTLTDTNGCTEVETVTVISSGNPIVINTALIYNECGQYNTIWVDITGGTGPYTVSWEGPQNGSGTTNTQGFEIMDLPPGTYKVIVVDANGCMVMQQGIIIYPTPIDIFTAYATPGICGENGDIHINVTGGTGPYVLQYTGPASGTIPVVFGEQLIPDLPTGTYILTLTDTNGCTEVETVTVINSGNPIVINTSLIYNECGQYNTIWVDITGGSGPYTVSWEGPQNGSGITNTQGFEIMDLPPGTYKVIVVDANGCMVMQQGIIIYPAPINLFTLTPVNGVCGGNGSIVINVFEGTAPYNLNWTGPDNGSATFNGNSYTIPNLVAGTYTLTLTDTNGCSEVEVTTVTTSESDVNLNVYGDNADCSGGGSITAQGAGGDGTYTLSWTGPESGSTNIGNSPYLIPDLSPGTYVLNLNDGNGCDDTESYTVNGQEDELTVSLTPTHGDCSGDGQLAVNITGGTANYTVSWTGPESGTVNIAGQFVVIPNLSVGLYTVSVLSSEGCADMATSQINNTGGAINLTATPIPGFCGQLGYVFLNISGGSAPYQVNWTGGATPGTLTTTSPNVQIPDVAAGTYTITVTSGSCSGSTVTTLSAPAPDLEITTSATNATCGEGGSIQVYISNATGPVTLNWTGPSSGSQVVNGISYTIPNLSIGTYTITANSGSCSAIDQVSIGNNNSNINVYATPTHALCDEPGSIHVTFSGASAPYQLSWTGPTNGSTTVNGNSYQLTDATPGTYYITVSSGNCSGSATATVYQATNDLTISALPQNGSCLTTPGFVISVAGGSGPYQVNYQGPSSGYVSIGSDPYPLYGLPAGQYNFTVTDGNGCTSSTSGSVIDNGFGISLNSQNGTCGDDTAIAVTINNGTGPYQISWYGEVDGFATTDAGTYVISNLPGGTYEVTVQDANGCDDLATISVISGNGDFEAVHSVSNNGCGALNNIWMDFYNGQGPYTVEWIGSNGGSDVTIYNYYDIQNASSGTYTIIITDANGCVDVQVVEVINIVNDLQVTFTPTDGSCGSTASIRVDVQGGDPWYTVAWNLGSQPIGEADFNSGSYTINNLSGGTYYIRLTDANGCQQTANVTVSNQTNVLQISTSIVGPGCTALGSIGLVMYGGQAPYNLSWSGAANGSAIATDDSYLIGSLNGGDYQVDITDANGCNNTLDLEVPGSTIGNLAAGFDYTADGLTVNFQNMSSNGSYFWQFGDANTGWVTNPSHTYDAPGTYQVCVSVSGSCGSDQHCENLTVGSSSTVALLDIGEGSGGTNATISLPVTIHNATNLISLAGTIEVLNEDVAIIVSATNGIIAPQFNAVTGTFSYFNNTGDYLNVNEGDVLFYVNVVLTGNVGELTVVKFAQTPLPIEVGAVIDGMPTVIPYTLSTGMASITNMAFLEGRIETYWGDGIENAEVTILGPGVNETIITNETGNYNMPALNPGMEYAVSAHKDITPENGLSTYALFIGQRFLLGYNPPQITSPYQVVAGDANCNDAFTTLDLFLIQRLIIGAASEFDNCPSWVFVADDNEMPTEFDAYNVFPYSSTNTMMLLEPETANFVGVKVGDILGHANPNNFGGGGDDRTDGVLPFYAENTPVAAGEEVTFYFSSDSFEDIVSYQFGMQFPINMVEFVEFIPSATSPFETVVAGDANADQGRLRLSWFSLDGQGHSADANTPLFALTFRALADIDDWNTILRLDPGEMLPEAYNAVDESLDPELAFGDATTATVDPMAKPFALYQNVPNPVSDITSIGFYLPQGGETAIMIHDAFGQLIWSQSQHYGAGEQGLKLDNLQLPAGVYYYSLKSGKDSATRSMIVVE